MGDAPAALEAFAKLVRDARRLQDISQDELAERSGVGRSTVLRYEKGLTSMPDAAQVIAVVDVLGIPREEAFRALGWLSPDSGYERPLDYLRDQVLSDVKDRREQLRLLRRIDEREREWLDELQDDIRRAKGA